MHRKSTSSARRACFACAVSLVFVLCLAGCGGGGSASTNPQGITISGRAYAPQGSSLAARTEGRSAAASAAGLSNVKPGQSVNVYAINETGTSTSTLATAVVGSGGAFSVTLPAAIARIQSNMIVTVGSGSDTMRAFVSSTTGLSVDPMSEFVFGKIAADTTTSLVDFSSTELADIYNQVVTSIQSQGLTFSSAASVEAAVSQLNLNATATEVIAQGIAYAVGGNEVARELCSTTALNYIESAKQYLFRASLTLADFTSAAHAVSTALSFSPDCPDANFLGAIVGLVSEADRLYTNVLPGTTTIFPIDLGYDVTAPLGRFAAGLPRLDSGSPPSAYQQEAASNTLPVLEDALTKLGKVRTAVAANPGWEFIYPKDPSRPQLGYESLDGNDIDLLTGAIEIVVGFTYYALAYNADLPINYSASDPCPSSSTANLCVAADTNHDSTLTPAEYLPPSPFATLKAGGAGNVATARTRITSGFSLLNTAVTNVLAETNTTIGGMNMTSTLLADVLHYRHYLQELSDSFNGTTSNVTVPASAECWKSQSICSGGSCATQYIKKDIFDPTYNTDETSGCLLLVTIRGAVAVPINLGAIFNITDFRNILPNYVIDAQEAIAPSPSYAGNTVGGLFPGGLQQTWFATKTSTYNYAFHSVKNSGSGQVISSLSASGITLTVGGVTITPSEVTGGTTDNYILFHRGDTLPTAADYISVNGFFPVAATLHVPGYQDKNISIHLYNPFNLYDAVGSYNLGLSPL